jgi:hypothetical protein
VFFKTFTLGFPDRFVLRLVDGDRGDDDIIASGVIVGPGAMAVSDTVFVNGFEE